MRDSMSHPFAEAGPSDLQPIGRVEEWADGQVREMKVHKKPIAVGRMGETFFAVNTICPHMGGPLSCGKINDGKLYCPWHEWGFDVETGECPNGHTIDRYRVSVEDGVVKVGWVLKRA